MAPIRPKSKQNSRLQISYSKIGEEKVGVEEERIFSNLVHQIETDDKTCWTLAKMYIYFHIS